MKHFIALALLGVPAALPASAQEVTVEILQPESGATVSEHQTVRGRVSDQRAPVWLVIHPIATNDCWVQPAAEIEGGQWFVEATFGLPQSKDAQFSMRAIVSPTTVLQVGRVPCWPEAKSQSRTIRDLKRK